eukprot:scaffold541615_cov48-Prasinocladus_malaysianus.AAC.1
MPDDLDISTEEGLHAALFARYPDLKRVLSKPWVSQTTWKMFIPVSSSSYLTQPHTLGFNRVVLDDSFFKPVDPTIKQHLQGCAYGEKQNDILFTGRFQTSDHKGQLKFLQTVPPEELRGFTVHYYGGLPTQEHEFQFVKDRLESTGRELGISVVVHGMVEHEKLLAHMCRARGAVLFPKSDMNPRAAYESLPAGNPVYVVEEAGLPHAFLDLPYVFHDRRRGDKHNHTYPGFEQYMETLRASSQDRE